MADKCFCNNKTGNATVSAGCSCGGKCGAEGCTCGQPTSTGCSCPATASCRKCTCGDNCQCGSASKDQESTSATTASSCCAGASCKDKTQMHQCACGELCKCSSAEKTGTDEGAGCKCTDCKCGPTQKYQCKAGCKCGPDCKCAESEINLEMPTCEGIRDEYIQCLLRSECVFIKRHSVQDCIKNKDLAALVPEECHSLRQSLFECKRGLLDMRKRMRGVTAAGGIQPKSYDTPDDSSNWSPGNGD
ncbi:Dephospho-CoA kinase (Dephosphocoenzyme A kinase) (COAE) [Coemansia sp. RSA 1200]|nr:Dephospho-CoA kinase (Dephosphocoenzyme A kinase) (COAE) [Coemansia sp. RSA 1200]